VLIGRPLGMSCGCPITHCGVATQVDERTGVIVWCVTGPLRPRAEGFKDLGYYIAEGYEGLSARSAVSFASGCATTFSHYVHAAMAPQRLAELSQPNWATRCKFAWKGFDR